MPAEAKAPRHVWRWVIINLVALMLAWIALCTWTLIDAGGHAATGRDILIELGGIDPLAADLAVVSRDVDTAETELREAERLMNRSMLRPLDVLPVIGRQVQSGRALIDSSLELTGALGPIFDEIVAVQEGGAQNLDRMLFLERMNGLLLTLDNTIDGIDFGPDDHLLASLAESRNDGVTALAELSTLTDQALVAVAGLESLLADGEFLLIIGSPAEMQSAGGMPLSVGRLRTDAGEFVLVDVAASESLFPGDDTPVIDSDIADNWGFLSPGNDFRKLLLTPRFEDYVGPQALVMWEAMTGQELRGTFFIDPIALGAVLSVVGDIEVEGQVFTADNAVDYLLADQYETFSDADLDEREQRRDRLAGIAGAAFEALGSRPWDPVQLLQALVSAANGRHIQAYSTVAEEQALWRQVGVAGWIDGDELMVGLMNLGGNKLDPYLNIDLSTTTVRTDDAVELRVGVRVINRANADLPPYVLGLWERNGAERPGGYVGRLVVFAPSPTVSIEFEGDPPLDAFGRDGVLAMAATRIYVPPGSHISTGFVITMEPGLDEVTVLPSARTPNIAWGWNGLTFQDQQPRVMPLPAE